MQYKCIRYSLSKAGKLCVAMWFEQNEGPVQRHYPVRFAISPSLSNETMQVPYPLENGGCNTTEFLLNGHLSINISSIYFA